jgi:hypothetical protein
MGKCLTPIKLKQETNIHTVPCGKCYDCYQRRISQWSFRLMQEEKKSSSAFFITLTYSDENLPKTETNQATLDKRDLQLFMKSLRKKNRNKIKYFVCGEYGDHTERPHYHMIIFNAAEKTIQPTWEKGQIHFGKVSNASVGYTLKYMQKQGKIPKHIKDDRKKEFQLMSKGLGLCYITNNSSKWHLNDLENRLYLNIEDNKKISMPRYYKDKIYNKEQRGILKAFHTEKLTKELKDLAYSEHVNKYAKSVKNTIILNKQKVSKKTRLL